MREIRTYPTIKKILIKFLILNIEKLNFTGSDMRAIYDFLRVGFSVVPDIVTAFDLGITFFSEFANKVFPCNRCIA